MHDTNRSPLDDLRQIQRTPHAICSPSPGRFESILTARAAKEEGHAQLLRWHATAILLRPALLTCRCRPPSIPARASEDS